MVRQGRQGRSRAWAPTGPGLMVGVVALSAVALVGHFALALTLIAGTVHGPVPGAATHTSGGSDGSGSSTTTGSSGSVDALHLDHSCLRDDNPPTGAKIPADDSWGSDLSDLGSGAELQRLYAVQQHDLVAIDGAGPVRDCDRQLWAVVLATTPDHVLTYVNEFMVFDADLSGTGSGFYVGEVQARDRDPNHWRLSIAPNGATDVDVALTVAHEVGHLLSLNGTEAPAVADPASCDTFYTGEGCLRDSSYLGDYFTDTWSDQEWKDWNTAYEITDDDKRKDALDAFYTANKSHFVDSYAATDPLEDFAESFGVWCALGPDSPLLDQVVEGDSTNGAAKLSWMNDRSHGIVADYGPSCERLRTLTK